MNKFFIRLALILTPFFCFAQSKKSILPTTKFEQLSAKQSKPNGEFLKLQDSLEIMAKGLVEKLAIDRSKIPVFDVVKDFKFDNTGTQLVTKQFQHSIDSCTANGPVRLFFPKGTYLTGTIILKSGTHIELSANAKIIASTDAKDYPIIYPEYKANTDLQVNKSLFYAEKVHDISFTGKGIIDFRGDDAVYLNTGNNDTRRPFGMRIISSKDIYVAGLMFINSPQWMQHYLNCENLMIENQNVFNHAHQNNDGMDIDGCKNVYIRNCKVDSDDDAICLKSNGPSKCENVLIEDCIASSHCNALKLGTETTGGFKNIVYRNCKVVPSVTSHHYINGTETCHTAITLIITDGGKMENVWFNNIDADDCVTPLFITLGNRSRKYTKDAPQPGIGSIENVLISNFHATSAGPMSSSVTGLDNNHQLKNVILENITLELSHAGKKEDRSIDMVQVLKRVKAGYPSPDGWGDLTSAGLYCRYVYGLKINNLKIKSSNPEPREPVIIDECSKVETQSITNNNQVYKIK
ncbi:polygalacturonase [Pedobacter sp. UYP30]|uniref:glycoside hydrolase family 28 protein n=1 Tax=Pedobacter sp. UYP30 TaxID=1756400 RepID=UPI003396797D